MEVLNLTESWQDGAALVRVRLRPSGKADAFDLWYRFDGLDRPLDGLAEAVTVGLVVPCMLEGEPLLVPRDLSATLVANVARAEQILASWYDDLEPVAILASRLDHGEKRPRASGVVCCFSGGVDSWYSLLKHEQRLSHLLLVRGFDIGLRNDVLWDAAAKRARYVAERLGKRLITCETNLREIADKRRGHWGRKYAGDFWGKCLHGAALASVALALRRTVGELIVPATHTYAQMKPWGSSPLLDQLWSDGYVGITHDGCEANRVEKVRRIAGSDLALETLRVCYHDTSDINCGRCEKCLRTMMALQLCRSLTRAGTFPQQLPLREIHSLVVPPHVRHHYATLRDEARRVGDDELVRASEILLNERLSVHQAIARLRHRARALGLGRAFARLKGQGRSAPSASVAARDTGS